MHEDIFHDLFGRQQDENTDSSGGSSADQFLKLVQDPFKTQFQANAFWVSLGTSIGVMFLITISFSLLRPYNSVVYAPKTRHADSKHAPPVIGKGMFAWFSPILKVREADLVGKVGLDGTIFLRFTRMCRNLFLAMSIIGCGILIPTNIFGGSKEREHWHVNGFAIMTPQFLSGDVLWSHVVCAWLFDLIIVYFLWRNYRVVRRLRRQHFESPEYQISLHSRTLMMTDIPQSYRTDEGILRIADSVEQTSGIPRAAIGRNVKELPELIEQHEKTVRKLESVLAKYLKNPDRLPATRPSLRISKNDRRNEQGRVDAIEYLTGRIQDLEVEIKYVRESVDKRNALPYGFASYERIEEAHTVAYAARNKHPQGTTIRLATTPTDLIWKNLALSKRSRNWKRFWNNFWVAILTVVWIAPNALIAIFLSNISHLGLVWPAFNTNLDAHPKTWAAVQGIASPALTSLVYLVLPIIFRRLSIRSGDTTKTSRERHVTHKLYAFFVFNNFVVFSFFSAIFTFISAVVSESQHGSGVWKAILDEQFFVKLMTALCTVSPFWVTWLLQRNLGAAADLAQIITLTWTWFARTFMSPTPRQAIEWTAPQAFDYASYYNYFLFYATIALCFATLQPLVLPVAALYFTIDSWLKKYLLLYVFITKNESGGRFWRILFNRFIFAAILANCTSALVVKARGNWVMVGCMAPLPILLLAFKWYCAKAFDDQCKYYTKATLKDNEHLAKPDTKRRSNDRVASRFGNPALYRKLITPMVHAKAQQHLSRLYTGRLGADDASIGGYSDIAMHSMSRSEPGKSARFAPAKAERELFEVVPESHLDFEHYKNRAEFREEFGGDGVLYGRPLDVISERSQTPRSFTSHGGGSGSSSRASSPSTSIRKQPPSYRDQSGHGDLGEQEVGPGGPVGRMYNMSNDSERRLLREAQPLGRTASPGRAGSPGSEAEREHMGLDRWRTGGSGYMGVPLAAEEEEAMSYDYFRGRR